MYLYLDRKISTVISICILQGDIQCDMYMYLDREISTVTCICILPGWYPLSTVSVFWQGDIHCHLFLYIDRVISSVTCICIFSGRYPHEWWTCWCSWYWFPSLKLSWLQWNIDLDWPLCQFSDSYLTWKWSVSSMSSKEAKRTFLTPSTMIWIWMVNKSCVPIFSLLAYLKVVCLIHVLQRA